MIESAPTISAQIADAVDNAGRLDGIVQMDSVYTLPPDVRYVTFGDATVAQALKVLGLSRDLGEAWRRRQARAYEGAVACCLASNWAARSVHADYGISSDKTKVVGFGANLQVKGGFRRQSHAPAFLFVGRAWERKNGPAVLRAFLEIRRRFPSATLDLVGQHPDVAELTGVRGHGELDNTTPAGQRALASLFRRATCLVVPSRFEPFGIVYVEAGNARTPSIGTMVGGAEDAIGEGGVLVDPSDEDALHEAMLRLCDPFTARRLGHAAKRNAARYTWVRVAERVLRALKLLRHRPLR